MPIHTAETALTNLQTVRKTAKDAYESGLKVDQDKLLAAFGLEMSNLKLTAGIDQVKGLGLSAADKLAATEQYLNDSVMGLFMKAKFEKFAAKEKFCPLVSSCYDGKTNPDRKMDDVFPASNHATEKK